MSNSGSSGAESTPQTAQKHVEAEAVALEKTIEQKDPTVFNGLPQEKRTRVVEYVMQELSMRSGPLPSPSELDQYNAIIPNGADRIMKMAESQLAHRISIEQTVVKSQQTQATRGQIFGFLIGIFGLGAALYAAVNGQPWFGSVIGGATLVSLVGVFVYGKHQEKKELDDKRPTPPKNQDNSSKNRRKK